MLSHISRYKQCCGAYCIEDNYYVHANVDVGASMYLKVISQLKHGTCMYMTPNVVMYKSSIEP